MIKVANSFNNSKGVSFEQFIDIVPIRRTTGANLELNKRSQKPTDYKKWNRQRPEPQKHRYGTGTERTVGSVWNRNREPRTVANTVFTAYAMSARTVIAAKLSEPTIC
jgi:hypothetical protein